MSVFALAAAGMTIASEQAARASPTARRRLRLDLALIMSSLIGCFVGQGPDPAGKGHDRWGCLHGREAIVSAHGESRLVVATTRLLAGTRRPAPQSQSARRRARGTSS